MWSYVEGGVVRCVRCVEGGGVKCVRCVEGVRCVEVCRGWSCEMCGGDLQMTRDH